MDEWFTRIGQECSLSAEASDQLLERGYVVMDGPVEPNDLGKLQAAYDMAMASDDPANFKVASTTTRMYDFVNRGAMFDDLYIFPPLLKACVHVIGEPFKLSSTLGRTLRSHSIAQDLHVDVKRASEDLPMVGFIYMVDDFRPENGATRFIAGSHKWPDVPNDAVNDRKASYKGEVLACGKAGSMIIFNGSVWHGHTANTTDKPRRSIQGYLVRRDVRSGFDVSAQMTPETLARIKPLAHYVLAI